MTTQDLHKSLLAVVKDPSTLGKISYEPDSELCAKLSTFHQNMDATRARALGMMGDSSAAAIAADFAAEYVDPALLKPVVEIYEEPRHWLAFANEHVRVFRVENPPGDTTLMHVHRVDSLYFFFTAASVQGTKLNEEPKDDVLTCGEVRYGDHGNCLLTHKIYNKGPPVMMCLDVELAGFQNKAPPAKRPKIESPDLPAGLRLTKERPGARVHNLDLAAAGLLLRNLI